MRPVIAAFVALELFSGCAWRETPRPTPVPGTSCRDGCHHVYVVLECGTHPIDVFYCQVQCEDQGIGDPECMAGADSCSSARMCG